MCFGTVQAVNCSSLGTSSELISIKTEQRRLCREGESGEGRKGSSLEGSILINFPILTFPYRVSPKGP